MVQREEGRDLFPAHCVGPKTSPSPQVGTQGHTSPSVCQAPVISLFPAFFAPSLMDEPRKDDLCSFNLL